VALLHIKQEFDGRRTAETRSFGVVGRDHALVFGCSFGRGWLQSQGQKHSAEFKYLRKHVINSIKTRLDSLGVKRPISRLLFDNLLDPTNIITFLKPK
jgi:hypothetical protein